MAAGVAGRPGPWPARHTLGTTLRDKQGRLKLPPKGVSRRPATRRGRAVESIARSAPPGGGAAPLPEAACAAANGGIGRPERFQRRCGDRSISKVTPRWALPSILSRTDDARLRQGWVLALLCNRRSEAAPRPWDRKEAAHTRIVWTQEEKRPKTSSQTGSTPVGWTCKMR